MKLVCLFSKVYNRANYNCAHLVAEAWDLLYNEDITELLCGFMGSVKDTDIKSSIRRLVYKSPVPVEPCIVLMQASGSVSHVGLYYDKKVLHITEKGVFHVPLEVAVLGFNKVKYYGKRNNHRQGSVKS